MTHCLSEPTKSEEDERVYRVVELGNDMRCILVSDPTTDKSSCSMTVTVGHFSDPDDVPGLAHFLEHMLFLGTEQYPEESSFEKFLERYGGHSNAYTSAEVTNYYFDVNHGHFDEALRRFASFFSGPLFTQSATERELNAVESENQKNLQSDSRRMYQLAKSTCDPAHVFSKFGTGNIDTLKHIPAKNGVDVRKTLIEFHRSFYSANLMYMSVLGRESLDILQEFVVNEFTSIKNHDRKPLVFPGNPFKQDYLQRCYQIYPVKELRYLDLKWPFPELKSHYKTKEYSLISHLVGHEGAGSILSLLKTKRWANELSAGLSYSYSGFSLFQVHVSLTEAGLEHIDDIIYILYQYLNILRHMDVDQWRMVYQERKAVRETDFRFKSKEKPITYTRKLSGNLKTYGPDDVLTGDWLYCEFDEHLAPKLLDLLVCSNMRYNIVSKTFEQKTDQTEKWYGTKYCTSELQDTQIQRYSNPEPNEQLFIPPKNEFLATDFSIFGTEEKEPQVPTPEKICDDEFIECWHLLDNVYRKPKAIIRFSIFTPEAYSSPKKHIMSLMFRSYLSFALNEYTYDAEICGLYYSLSLLKRGFQLEVNGYNQKMFVLFEKVIQKAHDLDMMQDRFEIIKEQIKRSFQSVKKEQPHYHARSNKDRCIYSLSWSDDQALQAIETISLEDLVQHARDLFRSAKVRCLAYGNIQKDEALRFCDTLKSTFTYTPLSDSEIPQTRVVKLQDGVTYHHTIEGPNPDEKNCAIQVVYQIGTHSVDLQLYGRLRLFSHLSQQRCFEQLRTKEQLGYIVWSGLLNAASVLFYQITVQSDKREAEYLDERIEAFLSQTKEYLNALTDEEFDTYREAVIALVLEKDRRMSKTFGKMWTEIYNDRLMFDMVHQLAEVLRQLTKSDIVEFYNGYICSESSSRRKLSVRVHGHQKYQKLEEDQAAADDQTNKDQHSKDAPEDIDQTNKTTDEQQMIVKIDDINSFKRQMYLYPDFVFSVL